MARTNSDDLLMEDDLAAAFLGNDDGLTPAEPEGESTDALEEAPQEEGTVSSCQ